VKEVSAEGAITLKLVSLSPKLRVTSDLKFSRQPKDVADARAALVQVIRVRGADRPFNYQFKPGGPDGMIDALEPVWASAIAELTPGPSKTVESTAATMEGCRAAQAMLPFRAVGLRLEGWVHPAVPINGLVRGKSVDGPETAELMEYGWSGGAPEL
jgi:hypothetical protein